MASPLSSSTVVSHRILSLHHPPLNRSLLFVKPKLPFSRTVSRDLRMRLHSETTNYGDKEHIPSSIDSKLNPLEGAGSKNLEKVVATILILAQVWSPLPLFGLDSAYISPAEAVLYSPDTKVPRSGELALRRAIPANPNMKTIQACFVGRYIVSSEDPSKKALWYHGEQCEESSKGEHVAIDDKDSILASIPADLRDKGSELYASLVDGKGGLQALIESIRYQDPDKVSIRLASSLDTVAEMELLQASGLSFLLPQQYLNYPRLAGRGTVEITIEKADGSTFQAESGGDQRKSATIQVVIDGYSAPLTAGNFAKLVTSGAYDGAKLNTVNQAVITEDGSGKVESVSVPLEVMPSGQFEPLYRTPLSVQDGELPVLPLSVYGAVAMAHSENSEEYSSPYQFFFYLYDKRNVHNSRKRYSWADQDRRYHQICKTNRRPRSSYFACSEQQLIHLILLPLRLQDVVNTFLSHNRVQVSSFTGLTNWSRLGVGRKFNHRRFIRRIGGVKALLNTSLLPSLAFRISFSLLGTINPWRTHLAEPGRPEHVQGCRTLRLDP
ncbi:hypothetical protein HID58_068122 [Brassica napus]|uniref:PPIase cyclophilin-type domain-containing protein n=1 Tax=Brassica napus TaxID=3708 RepID=A0ABQ7ZKN4_BRANA|nr:hypothetical protein HID58_068122 [Brassica napus]